MSEANHPKPLFKLGDPVVLKSYPGTWDSTIEREQSEEAKKLEQPHILIKGDTLHLPPIMLVTGIEIEDKKKRTHHVELGCQTADRIKYHVTWFDNKKSEFVNKVIYQSLLMETIEGEKITPQGKKVTFKYGEVCNLKTTQIELLKLKKSSNETQTNYPLNPNAQDKGKGHRVQNRKESLLTFVCPPLVMSDIKINKESKAHHNEGNLKSEYSGRLIKVTWFNYQQQKYSEAELPEECLIIEK